MAKARKRIEIYADDNDQYRWRQKSGNSRVVSESGEGYKTPAGIANGLESALEGYKVVKKDGEFVLSAVIVDGAWPETHGPRHRTVNIPLELPEKVKAYLQKHVLKLPKDSE